MASCWLSPPPSAGNVLLLGAFMSQMPENLKRLVDSPVFSEYRPAMLESVGEGCSFTGEVVSTQRVSILQRLFGKNPEAPVLPAQTSRHGGLPYLESIRGWPEDEAEQLPFVGQINFAELPAIRIPAPKCGIFVFFATRDLSYRWVWYPEPTGHTVGVAGPSVELDGSMLTCADETSLSCASFWHLYDENESGGETNWSRSAVGKDLHWGRTNPRPCLEVSDSGSVTKPSRRKNSCAFGPRHKRGVSVALSPALSFEPTTLQQVVSTDVPS